jgi:hypothetical protein
MKPISAVPTRLALEALETRTLLAADLSDPFGLASDFNSAMQAVSGTGEVQGAFRTNFGNHKLVLTGTSSSSITIDLDKLPSFITNLEISSFANVKFTGTDRVENLILDGITTVSAAHLNVSQATFTHAVASFEIGSLGTNAVLSGGDMRLIAHSLDDTTIFSDLHSLTLSSESKTVQFIALGTAADQTLNLTYVPDVLAISGISKNSVHTVIPVLASHTIGSTAPVQGANHTLEVIGDASAVVKTTVEIATDSVISVTPSPSPDSPAPDRLVIVSLPIDESTRILLEQLHEILHSQRSDSGERVLALLKQSHSQPLTLTNPLVADQQTLSSAAEIPAAIRDGDLLQAIASGVLTPISGADLVAPNAMIDAPTFLLPPTDAATNQIGGVLTVPGVVDVDVKWTRYFAPVSASAGFAASSNLGDKAAAISVADGVRALGSYIVERFSAEFSPGQQSLVLLVDPQPSRAVNSSRKSSASEGDRATTSPFDVAVPGADVAVV